MNSGSSSGGKGGGGGLGPGGDGVPPVTLPSNSAGVPPTTTAAASGTSTGASSSGVAPQPIMSPPKNMARAAVVPNPAPVPIAPNPASSATTSAVAPLAQPTGAIAAAAIQPNPANNPEVLSAFECPVCLEYMLPPYLQCQSGHLVCGNCRPKLTCCPTCRGPVLRERSVAFDGSYNSVPASVRNLILEKIANTVNFPCKYSSTGCPLTLLHTEKVDHEEACEFRPYCCPCPGASCKWQGNLESVMPHLMKVHKSITTLQVCLQQEAGVSGEDIVFLATDINLPGAVDWVMMQSCFGFHFMLVLEKQEKYDGHQMFYAVVQLIGSRKQAENFMYRLELSTHRRRLCWEATPRSIHEGVAQAISQSDCLAFDTSIAQLFAENGNLGINVTITMV